MVLREPPSRPTGESSLRRDSGAGRGLGRRARRTGRTVHLVRGTRLTSRKGFPDERCPRHKYDAYHVGLATDLSTLISRRRAMKLFAGTALTLGACGNDDETVSGVGSNGPNVLNDSGIVRSDITSSFGSSTTKAGGLPLTVNLVILDQAVATSQLALPEEACRLVYATTGYEQSVRNLARTTLARDNVFGDGSSQQLATVSGSVGAGYTAELSVPV